MQLLAILLLVSGVAAVLHPEQQVLKGVKKTGSSTTTTTSSTTATKYALQTPPLDTPWTLEVDIEDPWPQYPRPKLVRPNWKSLNGIWTYETASGLPALRHPPFNKTLSNEVLVPFCLESGLSGIQGEDVIHSWYRTTFVVPPRWKGDRVLLNFGAIDYEATVFVNGRNVTFHRGGYFAFSVDVTDHLKKNKENELIIFVFDPTDSRDYVVPIGKQTLNPSHIFYRPCSGIWQSVWLEPAPKNHISDLKIDGDANGLLNVTLTLTEKDNSRVKVSVFEKGNDKALATYFGVATSPIALSIPEPNLWTPDTPTLYDVKIEAGDDKIRSYTGFRTVTSEQVNGVQRVFLNGKPIFPFGTLDQGYWPDGLYTAPNHEAMVYDMQKLKSIGYNMLRKHVKIEPHLFYAAADEIGILVMQDMPCLRESPTKAQQNEFERQLDLMISQFSSYSSIFSWVIYNEGWGQLTSWHPEFDITDRIQALDPTRLVNAVSGWFDHGAGHFSDNHHYTNPQCGTPFGDAHPFDPDRIGFQGEFGGPGHNVSEAHLWKVKQAIDQIEETYELWETLEDWNYKSHFILSELLMQVQLYACAGAVWTQTTDVEGEVNGMMTYDRRIIRPDVEKWRGDIQALYEAAAHRSRDGTH